MPSIKVNILSPLLNNSLNNDFIFTSFLSRKKLLKPYKGSFIFENSKNETSCFSSETDNLLQKTKQKDDWDYTRLIWLINEKRQKCAPKI